MVIRERKWQASGENQYEEQSTWDQCSDKCQPGSIELRKPLVKLNRNRHDPTSKPLLAIEVDEGRRREGLVIVLYRRVLLRVVVS